jgi:hypothetical protein
VAHYGRWPALAGAAGLITLAALRRDEAGDVGARLAALCAANPARCSLEGSGDGGTHYADPEAQALAVRHDRLEQRLLVGGQAALIVSGAMFLLDLVWDDGQPDNIPYTPLRVLTSPRRIALSLPLP